MNITKIRKIIRKSVPIKYEYYLKELLYTLIPIRYKSSSTNVYHCCIHKTASQWIRLILSDPRVYRYSGLKPYHYQSFLPSRIDARKLKDRIFEKPFPKRKIVCPIYLNYNNFMKMPKPLEYKSFFVTRDPRDIVVSMYFSKTYSHPVVGEIMKDRQYLQSISIRDGLIRTIESLDDAGSFDALRSWAEGAKEDKKVSLIRFEDITGTDQFQEFKTLFVNLDIAIPEKVLSALLSTYSFKRLSGGRKQGEENQLSKYRNGLPGDWTNYFDNIVYEKFKNTTGDLVSKLGYQQNEL